MEKLKSTISAKYKSFLKEMLSFTEKKENLNAVLNSVLEAFPTIAEFFSATTQTLKQTTLLSNASLELLSLNRAISKKLAVNSLRSTVYWRLEQPPFFAPFRHVL